MKLVSKQVVDTSRSLIYYVLGRRGSGKSWVIAGIVTKLFKAGHTILDIYSSDNWENCFWCIPREGHTKRFPITLLVSETLCWDQKKLDKFNGKFYTEKEWKNEFPSREYDVENPPEKPPSLRSAEWLRIVKLPIPTKRFDSDQNKKIREIIEQTILDCRQDKRFFIFNPKGFHKETHMFWTLEIIIRSVGDISHKHFRELKPKDVGKSSVDEMTPHERNWDKMAIVCREFGELCPAKLKSDSSGESTRVKKSFLQFCRKCRHYQCSLIADWQKSTDVESSIFAQYDRVLMQTYSLRLAGDSWNWFWDKIINTKKGYLEKHNYSRPARDYINKALPLPEMLPQNKMYAVMDDDRFKKLTVPDLIHRHKEPYDNISDLTGIEFWHDKSLIEKIDSNASIKSSKSDRKALYDAIYPLRNPKTGKRKQWDDVVEMLAVMQENQMIVWNKQFRGMKPDTLSKMYKKLSTEYDIPSN